MSRQNLHGTLPGSDSRYLPSRPKAIPEEMQALPVERRFDQPNAYLEQDNCDDRNNANGDDYSVSPSKFDTALKIISAEKPLLVD